VADQVGFQVQPRRWVVERTIAWLNRCRRLSKDVEHLVKNSAAWIYWASIQRMVRYLAPSREQERPYLRKKAALALGTPHSLASSGAEDCVTNT
jgi:Transposase DDE domain